MMNVIPIQWIHVGETWISSFILWTNEYLPYQTVMLRRQTPQGIYMVYYFKLADRLVGSMIKIPLGRTNREEERLFYIAHEALIVLYQWLHEQSADGQPVPPMPQDLERIIEDAFISELGMQLIQEEHHPDFGFYSLSPNFKKIKKMVEGQPFNLLAFIHQ